MHLNSYMVCRTEAVYSLKYLCYIFLNYDGNQNGSLQMRFSITCAAHLYINKRMHVCPCMCMIMCFVLWLVKSTDGPLHLSGDLISAPHLALLFVPKLVSLWSITRSLSCTHTWTHTQFQLCMHTLFHRCAACGSSRCVQRRASVPAPSWL